jgi:hypothetical protein
MKPNTKRRFNAFDDYQKDDLSLSPGLNVPVANEPSPEEEFSPVERIERLKPSQMMPDRFQPRRILPTILRNDFYNRRLNCYETAKKWMGLSESDSAIQNQISQLLAMGTSFVEHGQIKPITGNWGTDPKGGYIFYIETGERRFWAACLNFVKENLAEEPELRVEVVSAPSRFRQVIENRHSEPPSAVGQACEIASIILSDLNIHPMRDEENEFKYFRQVHSHRMPRGLWDRLIPVMQLSRPRMEQLLAVLAFPDPLLELADRYRLSERILREVLSLPSKQWETAIGLCIHENISSEELQQRFSSQVEASQTTNKTSSASRDIFKRSWGGFTHFYKTIETLQEKERGELFQRYAEIIHEHHLTDQVVGYLESFLAALRQGK